MTDAGEALVQPGASAGVLEALEPRHAQEAAITDFQFSDRYEAGRLLGAALAPRYAHAPNLLVLGLPRGGVPVAYEIARTLDAPLDVFIVRKLGVPGQEELAMGAIATGGVRVLNEDVVDYLDIPDSVVDEVAAREQQELERRMRLYRGESPPPAIVGRTVILVDDGLATGATMRAAVAALRQQRPARLIVAVPTAAAETCDSLRSAVDDLLCAITPEPFDGVGRWYDDFSQVSDDEVRTLLARAAQPRPDRTNPSSA